MISSRELADRTGVSVAYLSRLVRDGLAVPSVRPSRKQGSPAQWSEDDVRLISSMIAMRRALACIGKQPVPVIRLAMLEGGLVAIGGDGGQIQAINPGTTVAQIRRALGRSFAVLEVG